MESIYNLIPKPPSKEIKKAMYRSKYDPNAPITGSTFGLHGTSCIAGRGVNELKKICAISSTFGPTKSTSPPSDPSHFLKKGSGTAKNLTSNPSKPPPRIQKSKRTLQKQKPPVPSSADKPIQGLVTSRNFITANAIEAIISTPKKRQEKDVDYLKKEDYGKIPQYLSKVKKDIQREHQLVDQCVKDHHGASSSVSSKNNDINSRNGSMDKDVQEEDSKFEAMDEQERRELISALKCKWDEVNSTYQKICHRVSIDSLGDIKRKEAQEAELQQLENDIEKLSKPGPLYIIKG